MTAGLARNLLELRVDVFAIPNEFLAPLHTFLPVQSYAQFVPHRKSPALRKPVKILLT
jgi:hypothetical protein